MKDYGHLQPISIVAFLFDESFLNSSFGRTRLRIRFKARDVFFFGPDFEHAGSCRNEGEGADFRIHMYAMLKIDLGEKNKKKVSAHIYPSELEDGYDEEIEARSFVEKTQRRNKIVVCTPVCSRPRRRSLPSDANAVGDAKMLERVADCDDALLQIA